MTDATTPEFDVPEADRAAYDAIPYSRLAPAIGAYLRTARNPTPEGEARAAHLRRLELVAQGRRGEEASAAIRAALAGYLTCPCCGGPSTGRTPNEVRCLKCQAVDYVAMAAAAATDEVDTGGTRAEAVERYRRDHSA
jgi:hypothetical protein